MGAFGVAGEALGAGLVCSLLCQNVLSTRGRGDCRIAFFGVRAGSIATPCCWHAGMLRTRIVLVGVAGLGTDQRTFGKAFKKPASERSPTEKTYYAKRTTKRRAALLDGIGFFT